MRLCRGNLSSVHNHFVVAICQSGCLVGLHDPVMGENRRERWPSTKRGPRCSNFTLNSSAVADNHSGKNRDFFYSILSHQVPEPRESASCWCYGPILTRNEKMWGLVACAIDIIGSRSSSYALARRFSHSGAESLNDGEPSGEPLHALHGTAPALLQQDAEFKGLHGLRQ